MREIYSIDDQSVSSMLYDDLFSKVRQYSHDKALLQMLYFSKKQVPVLRIDASAL